MAEIVVLIQFLLANPLNGIDPGLAPYFSKFQTELDMPSIDVPAGFADLEENIAGVCITFQGQRYIYLDKDFWAKASEEQKTLAVNHELGHCVLGLEHNRKMEGECPASAMYPQLTTNACLSKYPERYTPTRLRGEM